MSSKQRLSMTGQRLRQDRGCGRAEAAAGQRSERAPKLKASNRGLLVKMGGGREAERTLNSQHLASVLLLQERTACARQ